MKSEKTGAWLIHHTNKLEEFKYPGQYENILEAGKCGKLLSALSESDNNSVIPMEKVAALATASNIGRAERKTYLGELAKHNLIRILDTEHVEVLGVSSRSILQYTSKIFREYDPNPKELAVIELAEMASENPITSKEAGEYLGDTYRIGSKDIDSMFEHAEKYGFTDAETMDTGVKLFFNGNLFRTNDATKLSNVISSLNTDEQRKINELNDALDRAGCVSFELAKRLLGDQLFSKLQSIGFYDVNKVANDVSTEYFVTKPASFGKYGNPFLDDALDLAKALVTSLYYGMYRSSSGRGKIVALTALMNKLLQGRFVGPATAIGQDYRILELKRVVEIIPEGSGSNRFYMRLLKRDVGNIALQVLTQGGASEDVLLKGASVNQYQGPEINRVKARSHYSGDTSPDIVNLLRTIRK